MESKPGEKPIRVKGKKVDEPSKAQLYMTITDAINKEGIQTLPDFGVRFRLLEPKTGTRHVIIEGDGGECSYCGEDAVVAAVLRYCHTALASRPFYGTFTAAQVAACAEFWRLYTMPVAEPAIVLQASEVGRCWRKLPWDYAIGQTPLFDEILERCSDGRALQVFIGSLFFAEADRQQYLYLYGQGNNGKGSLLRLLYMIFGQSYAAVEPPTGDGRFWNHQLLGKRLVVFPDCAHPDFVHSPKFKMLTGNDAVVIERKGHDPYTAALNCKFIFASNDKPAISGQISDMRRCVFVEIGKIPGEVKPFYERDLCAEARFIVGKCIWMYKQFCGNHGPVPVDRGTIEMLAEESDQEWYYLFETYFDNDPDRTKLIADQYRFAGGDMVMLFNALYKHRPETKRRRFIKYLAYSKNVTRRSALINGKVQNFYIGAKLKNNACSVM